MLAAVWSQDHSDLELRRRREARIALSSRGRASAQLCARSDAEAEKQRAHAHHLWVGRVSRQMADEVGLRKLDPRT